MTPQAHLLVTTQIASKLDKDIFKGLSLIAIQHLLRDTQTLLFELKKLGYHEIVVLGKSYSSRNTVLQELNRAGIRATTHPNEQLDDCNFICEQLTRIYEDCAKNGTRFVILEDGGYIVPCLHKSCPHLLDRCLGAVEQTKTGYWRNKVLEEKKLLRIPVFTVANSTLKEVAEAPEVGNAIAGNIETLLRNMGMGISRKRVSILGYGWIGENTARALKSRKAEVYVYDRNPVKRIKAEMDGFSVVERNTALSTVQIIVGATGNPMAQLKEKDFAILQDNAILVNATSEQIEFDIKYLEARCLQKNVRSSVGTEYVMEDGKRIIALADGFPINFFVGESVPESIMDLIIAEMLTCLKKLVTEKNLEPKIYDISSYEEEVIAEEWLRKHMKEQK